MERYQKFAEALGFDDYESLMQASEPIIKEGDIDWYVTQLPDGRWAAWDDAELSLNRVVRFATRGEAVAFHLGVYATLPKEEGIALKKYGQGTWLQSEEAAYPHGRMTRRGLAKWPDGQLRRVWAGLPDTFYTIPAYGYLRGKRIKGFLTVTEDGVLAFNYDEPA